MFNARSTIYFQNKHNSDFVEFLKTIKEVETDELAIMLGQALLDCGIIHHGMLLLIIFYNFYCELKILK